MVYYIGFILDIKDYIASGIIESYVLGAVSDQERREVECMSHIYPEIREHLLAAQGQLETLSEDWKKEPPVDLKGKVMVAIKAEIIAETNAEKTNESSDETNSANEARIIALPQTSTKKTNYSAWLAAASVLLLIGISTLYFFKNNEMSKMESTLSAKNKELEKQIETIDAEKSFMLDDKTIPIALAGTAVSPNSKVKAYWNKSKNQVMLTAMNLPKPASDKQYQLWAIVDGTPVDLGMLENDKLAESVSKKVKSTEVQAFAITLEKKGGNPTPNLEQLYVIGNVAG